VRAGLQNGPRHGLRLGCLPRRAGGYADRFQARDHVSEHLVLATMQMRCACGIDDEAVRILDANDRRIAQSPHGKPFQGLTVRIWIRVMDQQFLHERLRLGGRHADVQSNLKGGRVSRDDIPASSGLADQHQR
jgi:hypothetical protein